MLNSFHDLTSNTASLSFTCANLQQKTLLSRDCDTATAVPPSRPSRVTVAPHKHKDYDSDVLNALENESMAEERVLLGQHVIVSPTGTNSVAVAPHKHKNIVSNVENASEEKRNASETVVGRSITSSMIIGSGKKIVPVESS